MNEFDYDRFYDSGLAALDAHKEELYEAVNILVSKKHSEIYNSDGVFCELPKEAYDKVLSIINQIEKEK